MDIYGDARKNLSLLNDFLGRTSYKPGWNIKIFEEPSEPRISVVVTYEGYESDNATFFPLRYEPEQGTRVREVLGRSLGQSNRKPQHYKFVKSFDAYSLGGMKEQHLIEYVIGRTVKEAEMWEFERWFKFEGDAIFKRDR